ncbi:hypothetical protein NDU88_003773 [Pleurodeles waltl]|uniref:Uncharacterized protein n=1 Tax=Pleurodeles waltl TaxID=8319 RepID=A0AAV7UD12_PLEWA|nr:hypothetical protein NDU88_003773 [Pleurodeles waltl]
MQLRDKAVQKPQVDDQTKIPCDFPDHEDMRIATVLPLPRRNWPKGTVQDQGGRINVDAAWDTDGVISLNRSTIPYFIRDMIGSTFLYVNREVLLF